MMDSSYQTLKRDYKINLSLLPRFIKPKKDWIHRRNARLEVWSVYREGWEEDGVTSAGFVSTVSRRQITESGGRDAVEFAAFAGGTQASGNRRGRTGWKGWNCGRAAEIRADPPPLPSIHLLLATSTGLSTLCCPLSNSIYSMGGGGLRIELLIVISNFILKLIQRLGYSRLSSWGMN